MENKETENVITEEDRIKLGIEANLPQQLKGLIMGVKFSEKEDHKREIIVSACSWHNSKENLSVLSEALPKEISISHGMCEPCFEKASKDLE